MGQQNGINWLITSARIKALLGITTLSGDNTGDNAINTNYIRSVHYSKSSGVTTTGANTTPVSVSGAVFTYEAN